MTPKVKILTTEDEGRWDNFVASHRFGTVYHTTMWKRAISEAYGGSPMYLYLEDHEKNIKAGLPLFEIRSRITGNRLTSVPLAQECNPLVSSQEDYEVVISFIEALFSQRDYNYIEMKTNEKFPYTSTGFSPSPDRYLSFILDLEEDLETIVKSFHKNCIQRPLKKISRESLNLQIDSTEVSVRTFYGLYAKMRHKEGLLPQPLKFFECLFNALAPTGHAEIYLARHEDIVVSSLFVLKYGDTMTYEYGASLANYLSFIAKPFPFVGSHQES